MSKQDIELTAYCGLYCADCIRFRSRSANLARDLLKELRDTKFNEYAELKSTLGNPQDRRKEFKHYRECCEVLETIVELQCNNPCRVGGGCPTFSCKILECCLAKGLEGCWECIEFENCSRFEFLKGMHGDEPLQNLRKIKELGLDKWAEHRHKSYVWL